MVIRFSELVFSSEVSMYIYSCICSENAFQHHFLDNTTMAAAEADGPEINFDLEPELVNNRVGVY